MNAERSMKGLAATGVGTVDCARHDVKRPTSVGDLQKGERQVTVYFQPWSRCSELKFRYVNMDYLFFSSLRGSSYSNINVSYDIACQWSINLWRRMMTYPEDMRARILSIFRFFIPKFHLPAHILACQIVYSFNYNRHVGRTDGEAPERGWSHINLVSTSTREMGPGSRRDTLDDHFGDWNWKKTTLMGKYMKPTINNIFLITTQRFHFCVKSRWPCQRLQNTGFCWLSLSRVFQMMLLLGGS